MSYLTTTTALLDAKLTNKGREKIAQGNFNISYFQIGDSEFDYNFPLYTGGTETNFERVISPMDRHSVVKYPYLISEVVSGTTTGTTIGTPIMMSKSETTTDDVGPAGFVSQYYSTGSTVYTYKETVSTGNYNSNYILPSIIGKYEVGSFVLVVPSLLSGDLIVNKTAAYGYQITGKSADTIYLDRNLPDYYLTLSSITVISTDFLNPEDYETVVSGDTTSQQDAWNLNVVWTQKPIGISTAKTLYQYESNVFVSTKEYFGYTTSTGQLTNTGTTITNAFGEKKIVLPEEQHSIAILHYSKEGAVLTNSDKIFKYDDYLGNSNTDGSSSYFQVYLPFVLYERNSGTTVGAYFNMDTVDYYINSSATDSWPNNIKYRYLTDQQGNNVGKIFVNEQIIIFDDQEIVAVLDSCSDRNYTLPIPKIDYVPTDIKCTTGSTVTPLLSGNTTGYTYYVTYGLQYTGETKTYPMPCNHYLKITGATQDSDISIKFSDNDFKFMNDVISGQTNGYIANKFVILYQRVVGNVAPQPDDWTEIDLTNEITLNGVGLIDPLSLKGTKFIITGDDLVGAPTYVWGGSELFGKNQMFPGSVMVRRASDIKVLTYYINLPTGSFEETQNPTYGGSGNKYITEVALLNDNFDMVVTGKISTPIKRVGSQVIAVKIDI